MMTRERPRRPAGNGAAVGATQSNLGVRGWLGAHGMLLVMLVFALIAMVPFAIALLDVTGALQIH
ncbi:MAG TPA: hypothetical protein VFQ88_10230 [Nevskiaceae bacterium]|nr:hypothetical protein [Nevskiaceae bacterium]